MIVYIQWLTSGYVYEHEKPLWGYTQSYDSVISIGGVWTLWAKDRLHCYGSSMYKVTIPGKYTIIWISERIVIPLHRITSNKEWDSDIKDILTII